MRIIDRYLLLEVSKVLAGIVGVVLLITVSMLFLRALEEVNLGALNADLVLRYLWYRVLNQLDSLLPPAFFLAVLVTLGRMARDSELIAIAASGMGTGRIYCGLAFVATPLVVLTAWLSLDVRPSTTAEILRLRLEQRAQVSQIAGLRPGRFYQQEEGRVTLYVGQIDGDRRLRGLFIQDSRGAVVRTVLSDTGLHQIDPLTGDHQIVLLDGRSYDGNPGASDYTIGSFERYRVRIAAPDPATLVSDKRSAASSVDLLGSQSLADRAELDHRIGSPLAIICLVLIAVPLSATSPRQRGTVRMLLAFLTYFGFFNLQRVAEAWMAAGVTPAWLSSLWYQGLILALVYGILLFDSFWGRRLVRRLAPSRAPSLSAPTT